MTGHRDPAMLGSTGVGAVSSLGSPARNAHASAGTSVQVLVVDDVSDTRFVLRSLLEPLGYEVVEASCGADANTQIREHVMARVIVDLSVTRRVLSRQAGAPPASPDAARHVRRQSGLPSQIPVLLFRYTR